MKLLIAFICCFFANLSLHSDKVSAQIVDSIKEKISYDINGLSAKKYIIVEEHFNNGGMDTSFLIWKKEKSIYWKKYYYFEVKGEAHVGSKATNKNSTSLKLIEKFDAQEKEGYDNKNAKEIFTHMPTFLIKVYSQKEIFSFKHKGIISRKALEKCKDYNLIDDIILLLGIQ